MTRWLRERFRRIDRWLLTRHPLSWALRLHWVASVWLGAAVLAIFAGLLYPVVRQIQQLSDSFSWLLVAVALIALPWARMQLRHSDILHRSFLPWQGLRFLYGSVLTLLLLSSVAFLFVGVTWVKSWMVVPTAELERDVDLLLENDTTDLSAYLGRPALLQHPGTWGRSQAHLHSDLDDFFTANLLDRQARLPPPLVERYRNLLDRLKRYHRRPAQVQVPLATWGDLGRLCHEDDEFRDAYWNLAAQARFRGLATHSPWNTQPFPWLDHLEVVVALATFAATLLWVRQASSSKAWGHSLLLAVLLFAVWMVFDDPELIGISIVIVLALFLANGILAEARTVPGQGSRFAGFVALGFLVLVTPWLPSLWYSEAAASTGEDEPGIYLGLGILLVAVAPLADRLYAHLWARPT